MLNKILNRIRPGLLTRLSNIIIIQLVFVFLAITIIFFFPANTNMKDNNYLTLKDKYAHIGQRISKAMKISSSKSNDITIDDNSKKNLVALLNRERIIYSYLFVQGKNKEIKSVLTLNGSVKNDDDKINAMQELIDQGIINYEMSQNNDNLIPVVPETHFAVYYYRFNINKRMPAVLVSFVDNKYLVSNRPQTIYAILILFLSSALVSLLLIYLINKRFQEPLKRLIMGLEKTAAGELYYLMESDNDEELNKLTAAFNNMSKTLWDNHKKLKRYNLRLKDAYMMLKESQKFLKTLIDSSPSCIISALDNGEIKSFNKKAVEIFGIDNKEAIGQNINDLFTHPIDEIKANKKENGDEKGIEILCRRGDGSLFPAFVNISPLVNDDDKVSAYLYIIKDISESKSFQEMMIRIDRYYTRGEMAGDIAHEINNFLAILSGNVELIPLFIKKGDQGKIEKKLALMKS
ncbi:MAG: PAS domain S-box protein, partial [FCB group bacterium]|nr:PAS domain S-box protein [FCB group bacterium]